MPDSQATPPVGGLVLKCDVCGLVEADGIDEAGAAYCLDCECRVVEADLRAAVAALDVLEATVKEALVQASAEDVVALVQRLATEVGHSTPPVDILHERARRNFEARAARAEAA